MKFIEWVEKGLKELGDGEAFCFNLYEDKTAWTCEFINTNSFDKNDEDWVCDEKNVYSRKKPLLICKKSEIDNFEEVLLKFKQMLNECLANSKSFKDLHDKKTVAYGFVDGDVEYLN